MPASGPQVIPSTMAEAPFYLEKGLGDSSSVSRILSGVAIYLRPAVADRLMRPTRRLRASNPRTPPYSALHRVGLAWPPCHHSAGALLPHHFTFATARPACRRTACCVISVALSLGFPPLDVIQHPALRCPDFPQRHAKRASAATRAAYGVYQWRSQPYCLSPTLSSRAIVSSAATTTHTTTRSYSADKATARHPTRCPHRAPSTGLSRRDGERAGKVTGNLVTGGYLL